MIISYLKKISNIFLEMGFHSNKVTHPSTAIGAPLQSET